MKKKTRITLFVCLFTLLTAVLCTLALAAEPVQAPCFTIEGNGGEPHVVYQPEGGAMINTAEARGELLRQYLADPERPYGNVFTIKASMVMDLTDKELVITKDTSLDLSGKLLKIVAEERGVRITGGTTTVYSSNQETSAELYQSLTTEATSLFTVSGGANLVIGATSTTGANIYAGNMRVHAATLATQEGGGLYLFKGNYTHTGQRQAFAVLKEDASLTVKGPTVYTARKDFIFIQTDAQTPSFTLDDLTVYSHKGGALVGGGGSGTVTVNNGTFYGMGVANRYGDLRAEYTGTLFFSLPSEVSHTDSTLCLARYTDKEADTNINPNTGMNYENLVVNEVHALLRLHYTFTTADKAVPVLWSGEAAPELWTVGSVPKRETGAGYVEDGVLHSFDVTYTYTSGGAPIMDFTELTDGMVSTGIGATVTVTPLAPMKVTLTYERDGVLRGREYKETAEKRGTELYTVLSSSDSLTKVVLYSDVTMLENIVCKGSTAKDNFSGCQLDLNGYTFTSANVEGDSTFKTCDFNGSRYNYDFTIYSSRPGGTLDHKGSGWFIALDPPNRLNMGSYDGEFRGNLTVHATSLVQGWGHGFNLDGGTYYSSRAAGMMFVIANRRNEDHASPIRNATIVIRHADVELFRFDKSRSVQLENTTIVSFYNRDKYEQTGVLEPNAVWGKRSGALTSNMGPMAFTFKNVTIVGMYPPTEALEYDENNHMTFTYDGDCRFDSIDPSLTSTQYVPIRVTPTSMTYEDNYGEPMTFRPAYAFTDSADKAAKVVWKYLDNIILEELYLIGETPVCYLYPTEGYYWDGVNTEPLTAEGAIYEVSLQADHTTMYMGVTVSGGVAVPTLYVTRSGVVQGVKINGVRQTMPRVTTLPDGTQCYPFALGSLTPKELWETVFSVELTVMLDDGELYAYTPNATVSFPTYVDKMLARADATTAEKEVLVYYLAYLKSDASLSAAQKGAVEQKITASGITPTAAFTPAEELGTATKDKDAILGFEIVTKAPGGLGLRVAKDYEGTISVYYKDQNGNAHGVTYTPSAGYTMIGEERYALLPLGLWKASPVLTVDATKDNKYSPNSFSMSPEIFMTLTEDAEAAKLYYAFLNKLLASAADA